MGVERLRAEGREVAFVTSRASRRHRFGPFGNPGASLGRSGFLIDNPFKLLDQSLLPSLDLSSCRRHVEEVSPVHFRKLHQASRLWGPFHRESVADNCTRITVALECP